MRAPSDRDAVAELQHTIGLDRGESEAIALALELGAHLLLDEYHGRRIAGQRGIEITGSVGIASLWQRPEPGFSRSTMLSRSSARWCGSTFESVSG